MLLRKTMALVKCYRILRASNWTRRMALRAVWWRKWRLLRDA